MLIWTFTSVIKPMKDRFHKATIELITHTLAQDPWCMDGGKHEAVKQSTRKSLLWQPESCVVTLEMTWLKTPHCQGWFPGRLLQEDHKLKVIHGYRVTSRLHRQLSETLPPSKQKGQRAKGIVSGRAPLWHKQNPKFILLYCQTKLKRQAVPIV